MENDTMINGKYDKINFLYRNPTSIFSPYMYFEGLKTALERCGRLHYAFDVTGSASLDIQELLKYPILCITGSSEPLVELVSYLQTKQFIAEICSESFCTSQGDLKKWHYEELQAASGFFDLYFNGAETELHTYWGKPCYWLPSWAHTEVLGDYYFPITNKIGFIGQKSRRENFFSQDKNGILQATNTIPHDSALQNMVELCKCINMFRMLINPESNYVNGMPGKIYEIMACNRLCFNQLNDRSMFKSKLLFRDNEDVVYFESFEELETKYRYYLNNSDSLTRVAMSGYRKVRQFHTADVRAQQIVERMLHHANGGSFDAEFNSETKFLPPNSSKIFSVNLSPIPKPFMEEIEIKSICNALQLVEYEADALEWGSGNSTIYFSQYISPESCWLAIEHNDEWARYVDKQIFNKKIPNVSLHLIPPNGFFIDGVEDGTLESFYDYVMYPRSLNKTFGFIFVDGRARVACMDVAWSLLDERGIMVLHDAQRSEYDEGIPEKAYCLKMEHAHLKCGDKNIATLFMSKQQDIIIKLGNILHESIPDVTLERFEKVPIPLYIESNKQVYNGDTPSIAPRCIFLNTYYEGFLTRIYHENPNISGEKYSVQKSILLNSCFGDSDFYSREIMQSGWQADDLIVNCSPLQASWAYENSFHGTGFDVVVEQLRQISPDVVYTQDLNLCIKEFFDFVQPYTNLVVGQIASPIPPFAYLQGFDIIISSFPHFVERFRQAGITSYYQPLAFEPRVLESMPSYQYGMRPVDCSFVGGLSPLHSKAYGLMEYLSRTVPIRFWGYGVTTLPFESPIIPLHNGEAWGKDMFRILASSKITINRHIDVAENYANNMRLFEATGCGALLITDYKDNLNELFEIGKEVVIYRSPEECAALVNYYLKHPEEAEVIAKAGQARTLRDHTYTKRLAHTAEILTRHLRYKDEQKKLPNVDTSKISYGHTLINAADVTTSMTSAWRNEEIPVRQRALVQLELNEMYRGNSAIPFKVLSNILQPVVDNSSSILEIGCASGYYYEILEYLLNKRINYTGVDYSEAMIEMAKDYYPEATFFAADGANLFFADRHFSIVISSCVLLHVTNWREHAFETARVAKNHVVASRTPVCKNSPTRYMKKYAYGVETVELLFNEAEFVREFLLNGLELVDAIQYHANPADDVYEVTYLFKRAM